MTDIRFLRSATAIAELPKWKFKELAIAGRSNVGKSSLINAITRTKSLARTSKTPGRTQSINFFSWADNWVLADLPGYGYARVSHEQANRIADLVSGYIERRANLALLAILIDAKRGPEEEEFALADLMRRREIEFIVVGTKCDKLKRGERAGAIEKLSYLDAQMILCSERSGEGIEQVRRCLLTERERIGIRHADNAG